MHRRFIRWRDKGVWEKLLSLLINEPDDEWPMIDASHCKVHPHAAGVKGGLAGSLGGVLVTPRLDQDSNQQCLHQRCARVRRTVRQELTGQRHAAGH